MHRIEEAQTTRRDRSGSLEKQRTLCLSQFYEPGNKNTSRSMIGDYATESQNPLNAELFERSPSAEEARMKKKEYGEFLRYQMEENYHRKASQRRKDQEIPDKIGHPGESEKDAERRRKQEYAEYLRQQVTNLSLFKPLVDKG
jgi:hypothetical protein